MSLMQRIRWLLQQPWFVGLLCLVAVLYVARNIVMPLVQMYGGGSYVARTADTPRDASVVSDGFPVAALIGAPARSDVSVHHATPADVIERRVAWFREAPAPPRNPFLPADDPRQPGYRPLPVVEAPVRPKTPVVVPAAPVATADLGLELTAVMRTPSGTLALINRQVVAEGDSVLSDPPRGVGTSLQSGRYRVEQIGEREVVLSGDRGRVLLHLAPDR